MSDPLDLDPLLRDWPFEPGVISARMVRATDGRELLQMRIEMGVLQMEVDGRPDGDRPEGAETFLDLVISHAVNADGDYVLSVDECFEIDREFLQFYHRRICWLALREFRRAIQDADHTLAVMDFATRHSPDEEWTLSHEQYRPFVLFHRTQAAAMAAMEDAGAEAAIEEINQGLERIGEVFAAADAEDQFDDDELVRQLNTLKESLRQEYDVGPTLAEQLADAIAAEQYERAARLRDEIARRTGKA